MTLMPEKMRSAAMAVIESIVPQNIMLALKNLNSRAAQEVKNEEEDYIYMILGVLEVGGVGDIQHGVLRRNFNLITIFRGFLACLCGIRTILAIWPRSVSRSGQYRSGNFFASGQFLFGLTHTSEGVFGGPG
jgi:hypothetical protein